MFSKRLLELAKFVDKDDTVLDVGCDHGYLSIYLKKNNLCKNVIASDISTNALNFAKKNISKYNLDIKTYVSDGFKDIPEFYDTAVIAGMGTSTILSILEYKDKPNKLIISSHNEHYKLRKELNKLGYIIDKESVIYENNHYYVIMKCIKGIQKLSEEKLKYGISNNKEYLKHLYDKNKELVKIVNFKKRIKLYYELYLIKKLIRKK